MNIYAFDLRTGDKIVVNLDEVVDVDFIYLDEDDETIYVDGMYDNGDEVNLVFDPNDEVEVIR